MRRTAWIAAALLTATVAVPLATPAQEDVLVVRAAHVITLAAGEPSIDNGVVIVRNGLIEAVGPADMPVPDGATVIEGAVVAPGFLDAVTRIGLTEIGQVDVTSDFREIGDSNPHLVAATAVHPASEIIPVTRSTGVTHAVAAPSGNGIAGQGSLIALDGWTVEEMLIAPSVYMVVQWPTLQTRGFDRSTFTRFDRSFGEAKEVYDSSIADLAQLLQQARRYDEAGVGDDPSRRDVKLEALGRVVRRELPLLVNVGAARGITDAVAFAKDNALDIIIAGGDEAAKVAPLLAESNVPVILGPTQALPGNPDDAYDEPYSRPAALSKAGVKFALSTYDASSSRTLPFEIATAVGYGLPREEALKAITLYPAQILGVDDRLGSIEAGKIANLVIADGDPLELETRVLALVIGGRLVDPAANKHDQLYEKYRSRPRHAGRQ